MSRALPLVLVAVITAGTAGAALLPDSAESLEQRTGVHALAETPVRPVDLGDWTTAGRHVGNAVALQQAAQARAAKAAAQERASKARALEAERRASRARRSTVSYGSPKAIAQSMLAQRGWSDQWSCLDSLWSKESGWRVYASNPSGAYGIPQAMPGSKMASAGSDWRTNPATQIRWGLGYIAGAYGSACAAWRHSQSHNWY
ncbi:MAG: transglycosylase SLT domain-containing protein [Frankiaceae bacterium]|nr:transglycosylase SLT domain-containing protein [Frankiaceae bacterium]